MHVGTPECTCTGARDTSISLGPYWAHLALLAAVGGALALGAAQQLVQRLATVLVVAEPNRVGAIGGARYSSSILSVWHDGLAPADDCQGSR